MWRFFSAYRRSFAGFGLSLCIGVCVSSSGCIALGIPSERFDDPADGGGLLGDFKRDQAYGPADMARELVEQGAVLSPSSEGLFCSDGSPLDVPAVGLGGNAPQAKPPEVPWPRFHPVPTRPVFGPMR